MSDRLLLIVPSRSRPQNIVRLLEAWQATGAAEHADLRIDVDADDPVSLEYASMELPAWAKLAVGNRWRPLVWKLNRAARQEVDRYAALGFMGDDHVPRTPGWAGRYLEALRELGTGIVYGDDGQRGGKLPTQWAMTSDIVRALGGRMIPAPVDHLYCDNAIQDLGRELGRITYLPDVLVEHMHPTAGKAVRDEQYRRVNGRDQYARDEPAYRAWRRDQLARDAAAVRAAIGPPPAPDLRAVEEYAREARAQAVSEIPPAPVLPASHRDVPIIATYARRDEPQSLVDDLRANLSWVDGFVELQTTRTGPWPHEGERYARQREMVRERFGECWVLFIDPDERLEDRAAELVPAALEHADRGAVFGFPLREMWTPTAYRCDGEWARKKPRRRLYHLHEGQRFMSRPIHCGVVPTSGVRSRTDLDVWMMHLKNIEPANRVARAEAYLAADPDFKYQRREGRDWSWLYDETGLRLEEIPELRRFSPPYAAGSYLFTAPR